MTLTIGDITFLAIIATTMAVTSIFVLMKFRDEIMEKVEQMKSDPDAHLEKAIKEIGEAREEAANMLSIQLELNAITARRLAKATDSAEDKKVADMSEKLRDQNVARIREREIAAKETVKT